MTTSRIEVLTNTDIVSHYSGGNISKIKCRHYKRFCLYQAPSRIWWSIRHRPCSEGTRGLETKDKQATAACVKSADEMWGRPARSGHFCENMGGSSTQLSANSLCSLSYQINYRMSSSISISDRQQIIF